MLGFNEELDSCKGMYLCEVLFYMWNVGALRLSNLQEIICLAFQLYLYPWMCMRIFNKRLEAS